MTGDKSDRPRASDGNEYGPNDPRNVTGAADTPNGRWSDDPANDRQGSGE